jgi:uncharacterized membrane protein YoaK (UPF0700 family)
MKRVSVIAALLSFNGGFVDTTGFIGLQGLFTAHVTGNFVTMGAALVFGTQGFLAKLLALPEFILVIALARWLGTFLRARQKPALPVLLAAKVLLLFAFFAIAVALGPFPNSDTPAALLAGFAGVAAMAVQNAAHRVHFPNVPPSTLMTGNTTQAVLDGVDLLLGVNRDVATNVWMRFVRTLNGIAFFALGCAAAAGLYLLVGFWCLAVPVVVGAASAMIRPED